MTPHVPDPRTLRRLAGEATPGPWVEQHDDPVERTGFYVDSHANEDGPEPVVPPIHSSYSASFADAAYIAAASPDVVLALLDERDRLRAALESMVYQFGYWADTVGGIGTGGLSDLEEAFDLLGWEDPHPVPEMRCDARGCMKQGTSGWPSPTGYRRTCHEHWAAAQPFALQESPE